MGMIEIKTEPSYALKRAIIGWETIYGIKKPIYELQDDKDFILVGGFGRKVPSYCCCDCGRKIIPYSESFEGYEYDGVTVKWIFNQSNNYCRVCAYKEAKKHTRSIPVQRTVSYDNGRGGVTTYFLDKEGIPTGEKEEEL